eukprot:6458071-Amphidinium_carterae.2
MFEAREKIVFQCRVDVVLMQARPTVERGGAWRKTHEEVRRKNGINADDVRWTATHRLRGVPATNRVTDCIDLAYQQILRRAKRTFAEDAKVNPQSVKISDLPLSVQRCEGYIIDVSQSAQRVAYTTKLRSMVSNSQFYVYSADRMMLPQEHLFALGWARAVDVQGFSASAVRELSGESMAAPCVALCLVSMSFALADLWT